MTRTKVISLFLTAVIILSIIVAPLTLAGVAKPGQFAQASLGGPRLLSIRADALTIPNILACQGCSGGGGGPG